MQSNGYFIILKKVKYSEADLIITALSSHGEKKSFLARSALKSKKRFGGGVLEPTHHVKLSYQNKEDKNQLNILEEAQLISDFKNLRLNYDVLDASLKIIDCVYKVCQEGDQNSSNLYNLLGHLLKNLAKENLQNDLDLPILVIQFYLKLLAEQGVLPLQPWMAPYLKVSLENHEQLRQQIINDKSQIHWLENLVLDYLKNARVQES